MNSYSTDNYGAIKTVDLDLHFNDIFEIHGKWISFGDIIQRFTFHAKHISFVGIVYKVIDRDPFTGHDGRSYQTSIAPPDWSNRYTGNEHLQTLMISVDHPKIPKEIRIRSKDDLNLQKRIEHALKVSDPILSDLLASKTKKERDAIRVLLDALDDYGISGE